MFTKPVILAALVVMDGVGQAAEHTAQRSLVQHMVNALTALLAIGQLAEVTLDEA